VYLDVYISATVTRKGSSQDSSYKYAGGSGTVGEQMPLVTCTNLDGVMVWRSARDWEGVTHFNWPSPPTTTVWALAGVDACKIFSHNGR
jgi:hypothetical protein